jgi:hypothetical protein
MSHLVTGGNLVAWEELEANLSPEEVEMIEDSALSEDTLTFLRSIFSVSFSSSKNE